MSTRNNPALGIMTQRVWRGAATAGEIGRLDGLGKGAAQDMGGDGTGSPAIGEEPARIAVVLGLPHPPQALVHFLGHGHDPFLVAPSLRWGRLLPPTRSTPLVLSMAVTGRAAASLIRRPQP